MSKHQIWKAGEAYAISDPKRTKLDFTTDPITPLSNFIKHELITTPCGAKQSFTDYLKKVITTDGVHPIYNSKGDICEQITNVPRRIMPPDEILEYLNAYTILPQETPPWDEIIYKLICYSGRLTDEYYERERTKFDGDESDLALLFIERTEDDIDQHYFVTCPKIFDGKKGRVFMLHNPTKAHRKWIMLDEYYDYKKNAWINPATKKTKKREGERIALIDTKKPVTQTEIDQAKKDFAASGGRVINLDVQTGRKWDWRQLEIHPLAHLIPVMCEEDRERLKEDIRLNGVNEALWLFEGKVLEGRTRYGICLELGIEPKFKRWAGPGTPEDFVRSMNIHRRHLTSSQLAAIGVDQMLEHYEKEAAKRRDSTRKQGAQKADCKKVYTREQGRATALLAERLKTNHAYINDAKKIKENSPELFQQVLTGQLTISTAKRKLKPILEKKKKRSPSSNFEKSYRQILQQITIKSTPAPLPTTDAAYKRLSEIYLGWNRRNEKSSLKRLEQLRGDFPELFGSQKAPVLKLAKRA